MKARTPARPAPVPIDDPAFAALKALVIARTGHDYYREKDAQLWEKIERRMALLGVRSVADYLERLEDEAAGPREWRALESAITINETFFFRFAEQFAALRRVILPGLIEAHAQDRRLRIWSVGCSTGAEPYSVAILLDELLGEGLADWRVTITGTDIDEEALKAARSGVFGGWALRTLGEDERARFFEAEGGNYTLLPRYRGMVRFERHNLMTLVEGTTPLQFSDYDLILCRNVLIYFDIGVATRVMAGLVERLGPDGWLLVGHAEPSPAFHAVAEAREVDGVAAYRRPGAGGRFEAAPPIAVPERRRPAPPASARKRRAPAPIVARDAPRPEAPAEAADWIGAVREALAIGDNAEAFRLAQGASAASPRDPVPHYLAALGAMALGEAERAERGFRSALYLDSGFAMAHYLLGRHLLALGRTSEGLRSLANAARVAAPLGEETALPEGDGMTAGGMVAAVRHAIGVAA